MGIRQASTFTGFCSTHDSKTFAPIETRAFTGEPEQVFLLGYRAICRGEFAKAISLEHAVPLMRDTDRGKPYEAQRAIQSFAAQQERDLRVGREEIRLYKALYDDALSRSDFSTTRYYIVWLAAAPDAMCSGATQFQVDFSGRLLQEWAKFDGPHLEFATFSLIATDNGGAAVIQWLGDSKPTTEFVRSLHALPDVQIPNALVRLAFEYFENVFMAPKWWEGLPEEVRDRLVERQRTADGHALDCLVDDGVRAVSWTVTARDTNALQASRLLIFSRQHQPQ